RSAAREPGDRELRSNAGRRSQDRPPLSDPLDEISQLVLLNAQEGGRLWEILVDPLWPVPEQPCEVRLDRYRTAVKDVVYRGWVGVLVDRGWPTQSSDAPKGQERAAVVDDDAPWHFDDHARLPKDQFKQV